MSIGVCGFLELSSSINLLPREQSIKEEVRLSFLIVEIATRNRIGVKLGGNVTSSFMENFESLSGKMLFEITDDPMDVNAECLFTGDDVKMYIRDVRIDVGESLFSRMTRVHAFLDDLLKTNLINKISLDINEIDFDEENVEVIEVEVGDFCRKMLELYERENNWTPTVRFIVRGY